MNSSPSGGAPGPGPDAAFGRMLRNAWASAVQVLSPRAAQVPRPATASSRAVLNHRVKLARRLAANGACTTDIARETGISYDALALLLRSGRSEEMAVSSASGTICRTSTAARRIYD